LQLHWGSKVRTVRGREGWFTDVVLRGLTLMLLLAFMVPAGTADVASERARLEGAWTAVEAEPEGASAKELTGHRLAIVGDRFRISAGDRLLYAGTFAIDPTAEPARIDFRHDEGEAKGQIWEGIYRLGGGRLSICDDAPNTAGPRPTEFATSPGSGHVLVVFER
jgi:uncharacterized protein (TIGR03067 family)